MKRINLLLAWLLFSLSSQLFAQWTNGTDIENTNSGSVTVKGQFQLNDGSSGHFGSLKFGFSDVLILNNPFNNGYAGDLLIKNWNTNSTYNDALFIRHDGHIGIGTTTPADKLDVNGSIVIKDGYNLTWGGLTALAFLPSRLVLGHSPVFTFILVEAPMERQ